MAELVLNVKSFKTFEMSLVPSQYETLNCIRKYSKWQNGYHFYTPQFTLLGSVSSPSPQPRSGSVSKCQHTCIISNIIGDGLVLMVNAKAYYLNINMFLFQEPI